VIGINYLLNTGCAARSEEIESSRYNRYGRLSAIVLPTAKQVKNVTDNADVPARIIYTTSRAQRSVALHLDHSVSLTCSGAASPITHTQSWELHTDLRDFYASKSHSPSMPFNLRKPAPTAQVTRNNSVNRSV